MLVGGWAAAMPCAGSARGMEVALSPSAGERLSARVSVAAGGARARAIARFGQGSAIFLLGLLIAGLYGAVLHDPDTALRWDRPAPAVDEALGSGRDFEPLPGTERQAWYRSGAGTVVNPLLAIAYPGSSTWLGVPVESLTGLPPNTPSDLDLATIAPGAGRPDVAPLTSLDLARSVGPWLAGTPETNGFLIEAFADSVRSGVASNMAPGIEPMFELGSDGAVHARLDSTQALELYFDAIDYNLDSVRSGSEFVPRSYVANLPPDLDALDSVDERKQLFIKAVLPVILRVNEEIEADRARLSGIVKRIELGRTPRLVDQVWLDEQFLRYDVESDDVDELLRRVDIIPPSLAIAQAAEESGWGTSRFAREGNALFGQYTDSDGRGITPLLNDATGKSRIRTYDTLYDTVSSYALNLNQHQAYEKFRELRAELRAVDGAIDGNRLAGTLTRYSERGKDYVKTIRTIMRENELGHFDGVRLDEQMLTLEDLKKPDRSS